MLGCATSVVFIYFLDQSLESSGCLLAADVIGLKWTVVLLSSVIDVQANVAKTVLN